ncbi:MAG: flagellar filament capping protein FliD [Gemmatimonadales bacterium]|nr:flagellar filament capping protein FliD [Gemmatimonadales bacterium]
MSTVSFSGLATGLDTGSIVAQLVELKRAPIYRLEANMLGFQNQMKALDTLKSKLVALQEAAQNLDTANEFNALTASSNDEDFLTVTAGSDAAPGNYTIEIQSLATAQKDVSQGYDSLNDSVGSGIMSFTVDEETIDLNLEGFNSLESLKNEINNNVAGVSASIVFDGSDTGGYHLVLSSSQAGSDGAFSVDVSGLSGGITPILESKDPAADAVLLVDGITVSASNSSDEIISGLTLDLHDAEIGKEIQVKVEVDSAGIAENVGTFVNAYNDLFSFIEAAKKPDGDLYNNPSLRSVANSMENIFTSSLEGGLGSISLFSQVGITRGEGRLLTFDEGDFLEALKDDFGGVRDFFIERDGNLGKTYLIDQAVENMTDSLSGIFKISKDALNSKIGYAEQGIERYERSVESYQLTLTRKFTAMELMVSQLNAQGNYLSSIMMPQ